MTGNAYLYYAAAVLDSAQAGEDFSQDQILPGILSLAQAVAAGITANAGGTPGTTAPPLAAQVINAAVQGVGGIYGVVQSAENGNALGIVTGALEAAAAGATGIGLLPGQDTQTLNLIAGVLGASGIVGNVANDFASGNLEQGLVDSLNLYYLPAVAQAYVNYQNSLAAEVSTAQLDFSNLATEVATEAANALPNVNIPDFVAAIQAAGIPPIGAATLLVPEVMSFTVTDGPTAMGIPVNALTLPGYFHLGANNLTAAPGFFGIGGDGNPYGMILPNGQYTQDPNQIAQAAIAGGWQPGEPIELFACFTGAPLPDGTYTNIAQKLANTLNTQVIAPTTFGWVYPDGTFKIAPAADLSLYYNSSASKILNSGPNKLVQGTWAAFNPQH